MHAQAACRVTFCLASSALSDRTNALCAMQSGPAYNSRALGLGDAILKVDGQPATPENFQRILVGNDKPGSIVTLTIVKGETAASSHGRLTSSHTPGQLVAVKLQRMSRAELVDKVLWNNDNVHTCAPCATCLRFMCVVLPLTLTTYCICLLTRTSLVPS